MYCLIYVSSYMPLSVLMVRNKGLVSLDFAILGFLEQEPATGYELKTRCFSSTVASFWSADQAQIYRTLERLKSHKYVTSVRKPSPPRPDRIEYSITPAGKTALDEWLRTSEPLPAIRDAFALKMHFSHYLPPATRVDVYSKQRDEHQVRLLSLRARLTDIQADSALDSATKRTQIDALTCVMAQERATIDALDNSIEKWMLLREGA